MNFNIDTRFNLLIEYLRMNTREEIEKNMLTFLKKLPYATQDILEKYFVKYPYWGSLNIKNEDYDFLIKRSRSLKEHADDLLWLYEKLGDYRSKMTLYETLNNWIYFNTLEKSIEPMFNQYFDLDIIQCDENEIFIDAGAFIGDTALSFINNYGKNYKKIYCYEITPNKIEYMKQKLSPYKNIILKHYGLSDKYETLFISEHENSSSNSLKDKGEIGIETVTLDGDVEEPVTFIKMDIEGAEQRALLGCEKHIINDKPKLAISVYHNNEDIWKIPQMIYKMCPEYTFYMRYNGQPLFSTELVLFAVCK